MTNAGRFAIAMVCVASVAPAVVRAGNVTIDGTIRSGFQNTRLTGPNYQLNEAYGKLSSNNQNLLLSLQTFDLSRGESARFTSELPLKNIVTRITGGVASRIDGAVISDVQGAALFLINPKGIVIGPTASFQVNGALHLSTASNLSFADGTTLDLTGGDDPVLSSAAPAAFGFLAGAGSISAVGGSFAGPSDVATRNAYSLTAGAIALRGTSFDAPGGVVSLHATGGAGRVTVATADAAGVMSGAAGGSLAIASRTLGTTLTPSSIEARNGGLIRVGGGNVAINGARLTARSFDTSGRGIELAATKQLHLSGGANIEGGTEGPANAPPISLSAASMLLESDVSVTDLIETPKSGNLSGQGGGISLTADDVTLLTRAQVRTSTSTASDGAAINVVARRSLVIDGVVTASALTGFQTQTDGQTLPAGHGGAINLTSPSILITREGDVAARTVGAGDAGDITVRGGDMTLDADDLKYTGFESRAGTKSVGGAGGTIDVRLTGDLLMRKGGAISASTFEPGAGGEVFVTARNVYATETGLGNVDPITGEFFNGVFSRSARIKDSTSGELSRGGGRAGGVSVTAENEILVAGGSQMSVRADKPSPAAGDVVLNAPRITITNGTVTANSFLDGGNVRLEGDTIIVNDNSVLDARAGRDGGTFTIAPANVVVLGNGSSIQAVANGIPVQTTIDTSATFIKSADAVINAQNPVLPPDVDVAAGLLTFTVNFVDAARQLQPDCLSRGLGAFSSFTVEPRGGAMR